MPPSAPLTALERAIELVGGQTALATLIGVRTQAISYWKAQGHVPVDRCADIHRATRGEVSFSDLCPEIAALVLESALSRRTRSFTARTPSLAHVSPAPMESAMT